MRKLNEQLSIRSAVLIVVVAVLFVLGAAGVAKAACGSAQAIGCDENCTVQTIKCDVLNDCAIRSCQCPNRNRICGGCVLPADGCDGLAECCIPCP
jgi:hypothetical protein